MEIRLKLALAGAVRGSATANKPVTRFVYISGASKKIIISLLSLTS